VRLILRFFAMVTGLYVLSIMVNLVPFWVDGGLRSLAGQGFIGIATIIGWFLVLGFGPFAAVYLWQLRRFGLYLTAFLFMLAAALSLIAYLSGSADQQASLGRAFVNVASFLIVVSPPARRACTD
jgi:hypothetical protein